jgi:hypothetical protein
MQGLAWIRDIKGALIVQVVMQYLQLFQRLQSVQLRPGAHDQLVWRWNPNGCYSSGSAYTSLMLGQSSVLGCMELWKTKAPNNCRFFVWLVLLGRCWTADRLHRRGLRSDSTCILCCQGIKTIDHILVQCVFALKFGSRGSDALVGRPWLQCRARHVLLGRWLAGRRFQRGSTGLLTLCVC